MNSEQINKEKSIFLSAVIATVIMAIAFLFIVFLANEFSFYRDFSGADQFVQTKYKAEILRKRTALLGYETGYLLCQNGRVIDVEIDRGAWERWIVTSEQFLPPEVNCSH